MAFVQNTFQAAFELPAACGAVLRRRRLLRLVAKPFFLGSLLFLFFFAPLLYFRHDLIPLLLGEFEGLWSYVISWAFMISSLFVAGLVAFIGVIAFGSLSYESIALEGFVDSGLLTREAAEQDSSTLLENSLLISGDVLQALIIAVISVFLLLLSLIPPFLLITPVCFALLLGYEVVDLALAALQIPLLSRWKLLVRNIVDVLVLGAVFTVSMIIPFGSLLFYGPASYAASKIVSRWDLPEAGRLKIASS